MEAQLFDMFVTFKAIEAENQQSKEITRKLNRGRR